MAISKVKLNRNRRRARIRAKISGTATCPRLSIFKSNKAIYAQAINDDKGLTLASASGNDPKKVGTEIAKALLAKSLKKIVFDRGGYIYTGRVRTLAEAARAGGLQF